MSPEEWSAAIQPWLRPEAAPAYRAALEWLLPRCRTEEERALAPALLLLLAPLNALVAPCRPAAESRVNFQVTLSRQTEAGPERVRLTVRTAPAGDDGSAVKGDPLVPDQDASSPGGGLPAPAAEEPMGELRLDEQGVPARPLACAAWVLAELLERGEGNP